MTTYFLTSSIFTLFLQLPSTKNPDNHTMPSHLLSKPDDIDTRSMISLQELDPSPVHDVLDIESGEFFPRATSPTQHTAGISMPKLGLSGHSWDSWRTSSDKMLDHIF